MTSIVPAGGLVYGMQLPVQAQSTIFAEPWEAGAGAAELAAITETADRAGFFYVAVCDHVAIPRDFAAAMGTTWYDTMTTLGFLAGRTQQVRLLSHVFVPAYRHPLVVANGFATLDAVSGGRAIVGVGAGHLAGEFAALGVDFHRRGALLDEALEVIDEALREEFVGDVAVGPRPVQSPRPPIWVGGSSPAAVRRAARSGDGWLPQGTPRAKMPELIAMLHEERAGVRDDAVDVGAIAEWLYVGTPGWDVNRPCVSGTPDELAASLREFAAMGVGHLQVRFPSRSLAELLEQVEAFGTQVGPLLAH